MAAIDRRRRTIGLNITLHASDREVRASLLHEMCHLAAGAKSGYDSSFFVQLERLLRLKAPIGASAPENQNRPFLSSIPARFKRIRAALSPHYDREQRRIKRLTDGVGEQNMYGYAQERFESAGMAGIPWSNSLLRIGDELAIVDADGRIQPSWRRRMVRLRRAHKLGLAVHKAQQAVRNVSRRERSSPGGEQGG